MKASILAFLFFSHFLSFAQWQAPNNTNTVNLNPQNASRNVGIGTTNAAAKLHVVGNTWLNGITSMTGMVYQSNAITFTGSNLDFFTPVQAQYNGGKPILSLSQFGEINFFSSPYLNQNTLYLGSTGDFNHGIRQSNNFGGASGFDGPVVFGQNGGALGSSTQNQNWTTNDTKVALSWNNDNVVKIHKSLQFADGTLQTTAGQNVTYNASNNYYTYQGNVNIPNTLKIGTNSMVLNGKNTNPLQGISQINELFSSIATDPLYINKSVAANTIINETGGNVGIGVSIPTAKLEIGGSTKINGDAIITGNIDIRNIFYIRPGTAFIKGLLEVEGNFRLVGGMTCKDLCVNTNASWCDYVFENNYKIMSLNELEKYIKINKHLPEIPQSNEIEKNGIQVNKIITLQMKKIEELTLYMIEANKKIELLSKKLNK